VQVAITIKCDNAAFGEEESERAAEVVRIVRRWADRATQAGCLDFAANVFDSNGNKVGTVEVSES